MLFQLLLPKLNPLLHTVVECSLPFEQLCKSSHLEGLTLDFSQIITFQLAEPSYSNLLETPLVFLPFLLPTNPPDFASSSQF